jgi:hypothetical protein
MPAFLFMGQDRQSLFFIPAIAIHRTDVIANTATIAELIIDLDRHFSYLLNYLYF